jgi:GDPmannose 4,6-dehydratase
MEKVALITGISGQDGSYLSELLLEKGYVVYGIIRKSSTINTPRIDHIFDRLKIEYGDLTDFSSITAVLSKIRENHHYQWLEIYNLAAQSHVHVSFKMPISTSQINGIGVVNILEAVKTLKMDNNVKFYQASTSELFGDVKESPQNEFTPFNEQSPYAIAKGYAHKMCNIYRESYSMYINNFILFNHESPRRGETFVTRKVTLGIKDIMIGKREFIEMGNLNSLRDWGHAKDYVNAMWMGMQLKTSGYYVVSTGEQHTVKEFIEKAFKYVGVIILWRGEGINEVGIDGVTGIIRIKVNPRYFRPLEVNSLLGDSSKFRVESGWSPSVTFDDLIIDMIKGDVPSEFIRCL